MGTLYLRIEAVNLDNFVYDTTRLHTIRGASLALLEWPKSVQEAIERGIPEIAGRIKPITLGASTALLEIRSKVPGRAVIDPSHVVVVAEKFFRGDETYKHATFVVDAVVGTRDFHLDRERLMALNRKRQMRQLDLSVPAPNKNAEFQKACWIDGRSPATADHVVDGKRLGQSTSVRFSKGRAVKGGLRLLFEATGQQVPPVAEKIRPAGDLDDLTSNPNPGDDGPPANLARKMAVIYIDGNRFSEIEEAAARAGAQRLRDWDQRLRQWRAAFLEHLLNRIWANNSGRWANEHAGKNKDETSHRIEVLLWGGDEFALVVPAWNGLGTVQLFFQQSTEWSFQGRPLRHAAGLVFSHHNAPIRDVVKLARRLAELAKEHDPDTDGIAYQVLESFDHLGEDIERVRALRRPHRLDESDMILRPNWQGLRPDGDPNGAAAGVGLGGLFNERRKLEERDLPRRRHHQIAHSLFRRDDEMYEALIRRIDELAFADGDELNGRESSRTVRPNGGNCARSQETAAWLHLIELWDYFCPLQEDTTSAATVRSGAAR
jgi:hypothetical protein